ncbi:gliding motility lipoprotein GldJ [Siphonobacter aquaeclarae]|uniref:Gliding motility-associated lipoprotein GldJ/gliding motility-associated lipoprotein GldJ,TIGR03530 n=1 Tax=Siphonobacter aquaeclarae TaxID=563176 RepID=A0A1G9MVB9_9BACT|nr:gliding motility lipoprotein GldJ [Siphonobacter aquaeclarae]SDL77585.1 gliding motility-associated lipoprotein GldJ/gliding motility-associated lipoprotein GldJ,TIGR03530 [Siphonobacter aquaeclarae]
MMKIASKSVVYALASVALLTACSKNKRPDSAHIGKSSTATGIAYNAKDGFKTPKSFKGQPTGPNLVYIEGGRFTMGTLEEDVAGLHDNVERTVTVQSFFMDETEIANVHYLEYLYAIQRDSTQEVYEAALPDTTVWAGEMAFNDTYVDQYLRYPGFRMYPVVGVSWVQAQDYSAWRTQAVNADLARKATTGGSSKKKGKKGEAQAEVAQTQYTGGRAAIETGYVLPDYRLPTEAEWEYAAKALIGTQYLDENQSNQRIYPWDGSSMRKSTGRKKGMMLANYKRGRGDYAGIAGKSNDGAIITDEVFSYPPNDFGLYNMAGNVNEWVWDVYRPTTFQTFSDLNPVRRNGFLDDEKNYDKKDNNSLIDNRARVYKGGSWADVSYWLSPGTRRYMDQDSSTATIGFRCSMIASGRKR